MEKLFLDCDCEGEGILLKYYPKDKDYALCILHHRFIGKTTFWGRLKTLLKYVFKGRIYGDDIIISNQKMNQLVEFYKQNINNIPEEDGLT